MEYKHYYNYDVYEDGRVFSHYCNKFLVGEVTRLGYLQYTLSINGKSVRIRAHQLVAKLFIPNSNKNFTIINHIDGNKLNNHYSNLEWCDSYINNKHARETGLNPISKANSERWNNDSFRKKTSKNISIGLKKAGNSVGHKNPRFRYVIKQNNIEITRQELAERMFISQSWADVCIRNAAHGERITLFDVNNIKVFDTKEKSSSTIRS